MISKTLPCFTNVYASKIKTLVSWEDLEGAGEREVGGGIGMGNTCKPMAVSFQCMTKFTTNKKNLKIKKNKTLVASSTLPTNSRVHDSKIVYFINNDVGKTSFKRESQPSIILTCLIKTNPHNHI